VVAHGPSLGRKRLEDVRYSHRATAYTALHNMMSFAQEINSVAALA
jgi:hypothetical protein